MARKKIPENYEKMRQGIITAAIELMVKGSITDFSLTDVAEKVGLSKAALYWYFPNKDALIDQVVQNIYDTYIGYIEKISSSDLSSYEKLRLIVLGEEDTLQAALMSKFITGAIDGLAFQNLLVSSEKPKVSRAIIFSVLDQLLKPPSTRKEEPND